MTLFEIMEFSKELSRKSEKPEESDVELLTAESLRYLNSMTRSQLETIYKNGKRKVKIDNDPEAYRQLNGMTRSQLEAIFGEA